MHTKYWYILCTTLSSLAFSQQLDIITLERLVIEGNPDLLASEKQIDISTGELEQNRSLPNPVMEFELGPEPETAAMITQTILLGGKRRKIIKLSDLNLNKAQLEFEFLKQTKLTEAFGVFVAILHLQEKKTLQQDRVKVAEDLLNAVTRKVEAGKLSPAEKSRSRIKLIQEQLKLRTIEKSLSATWNSISALWGNGKPSFNYAIGDLSLIKAIPAFFPLNNAPDIQISKRAQEIQKMKVQLEKTNAIPDIELGAGLKPSGTSGNTYQMGLSIPLPIFDRNKGNIKSAESELEQSQLELQAVESQLRTNVSNLQTELEILTSEISILNKDIIPEAKNAFTIITDGYLNGRYTYLDVVDAQEIWFQTRGQYLDALQEFHQTVFELDLITGNTNHSYFMEKN